MVILTNSSQKICTLSEVQLHTKLNNPITNWLCTSNLCIKLMRLSRSLRTQNEVLLKFTSSNLHSWTPTRRRYREMPLKINHHPFPESAMSWEISHYLEMLVRLQYTLTQYLKMTAINYSSLLIFTLDCTLYMLHKSIKVKWKQLLPHF